MKTSCILPVGQDFELKTIVDWQVVVLSFAWMKTGFPGRENETISGIFCLF